MTALLQHGRAGGPGDATRLFLVANLAGALALAVAVLWNSQGNEARRAALAACSAVFTLRTAFMTINLLPRRIGWLEAVGNALLIYLILYGLAALANNTHPWDQWDFLFLVVFASGSSLTTGSEWARKRWKDEPGHRGKLYTTGAFRYAQHINYFGEVISFSGFAGLTRSAWPALVPFLMLLGFIFIHIPALDQHLALKYGKEFELYRKTTKRLIPFVW